ncbi:MAG: GDP-L-fucose synthase [Bacteroidales bacterium]|jgi:GDP-L-fucose synthase|nr:GDP-L-fucose synthase [Bacteroidales bacterium]
MNKQAKIYVAGHQGMVGSAILRQLKSLGYQNFVLKTFSELDLSNQADTHSFFQKEKPDYVFLAAAKVGGILANNTYKAQFIYENLMIQNNVIHAAYQNQCKKLLFLGSSCIYPKKAPQPLVEKSLLTGLLEETNEPYAIAKIAGIKMCESYFHQYGSEFISVMPTNLYGENDNYDLEKSHVLPAMIRKMHLGKQLEENNWELIRKDLNRFPIEGIAGSASKEQIIEVLQKYGVTDQYITLWGTGNVYREFLHVDDMAAACVYIMEHVSAEQLYHQFKETHINIGTGIDLTISDLATTIQKIVGYQGAQVWDHSKPDGTYRKQLDISLLKQLGFTPSIELEKGIDMVYKKYLAG